MPEYESLNGSGSRTGYLSWSTLTPLEKKLIALVVIESILVTIFGIGFAVAYRKDGGCSYTTIAPLSSTTTVIPSTTEQPTSPSAIPSESTTGQTNPTSNAPTLAPSTTNKP